MDEKELIKLAKAGQTDAFEKLIEAHQLTVYNISLKMLKNEQDAFDAAQDSLIKAFKYISKFKGNSSFSTWIYKITVNTCLDYINKNKKNRASISLEQTISLKSNDVPLQFEDKNQNVVGKVLKNERERILYDALDKLNTEQKQMIILRDVEGFSYEEISKITDLNIGTVKSKISRARLKLREILSKHRELFLSIAVILITRYF